MTDVRSFGAKGDGVTDDTKAVQHAVEQGDGHLVFPRGTYRLSGPIVVELLRLGPFAISGEGGVARLRIDVPGPALRIVGTHDKSALPSDFRPTVWERERMPTVSDIEIVGNHEQSDGIELEGTMQATIRGVLIRRCRYGIHLVRRNRNILVADSHIYHGRASGIGIFFDGVNLHQTNIIGCHISYCPHAGIKVQRSEIRNLQITGCDIEYNHDREQPDSADVWIDAREGTVREGTIASNTIQAKPSPGGANIRIEGPPLDAASGAGLWTIVGNVLQDQETNLLLRSCRGVAVTGNSFAVAMRHSILVDRSRHITIGTNTFDHNPDYGGNRVDGIAIRGSANVILSGLILEDSRSGTPESGAAIDVRESREITISSCQILDSAYRGIDLADVSRSRINDCTILDRRPAPTMREAIRVAGRGRDNVVINNMLGGATAELVAVSGSPVVQTGNVVAAPSIQ
jgi:parallel beta-helix repeat protein